MEVGGRRGREEGEGGGRGEREEEEGEEEGRSFPYLKWKKPDGLGLLTAHCSDQYGRVSALAGSEISHHVYVPVVRMQQLSSFPSYGCANLH